MKRNLFQIFGTCLVLAFLSGGLNNALAQTKDVPKKSDTKSIGGKEHETNILGVTIGMDVSTALETVFVNANRKPGQEKPDAKKMEGKDKKDIRVVFKNLPDGELQIVFADGKYVKEMILVYAKPPLVDDLRLSYTGSLGNGSSLVTTSTVGSNAPGVERGELSTNTKVLDGTQEIDGFNATNLANTDRRRGEGLDGARFDDRYSVGFTDNQKLQRIWWRDEKTAQGYKVRFQFVSENKLKPGASVVVKIAQKIIFLSPENEKEFRKVLSLPN